MGTAADVAAPRTRAELRWWTTCDLAAHGLNAWRTADRTSHPVVRYQLLRRRAEYRAHGTDHRAPAAVRARLARWSATRARRLGLDVPLGTAGPGLLLVAGPADRPRRERAVRVHPEARLGSWCTLHAGVVVDLDHDTGVAPRLGDRCRLGERAEVLGARLGHRVDVAAGARVTDDHGDDVHLAGRPATVVDPEAGTGAGVGRDGRRTELTAEQAWVARRLASGGMAADAVAAVFWVSRAAVDAAVGDPGAAPGPRRHRPAS